MNEKMKIGALIAVCLLWFGLTNGLAMRVGYYKPVPIGTGSSPSAYRPSATSLAIVHGVSSGSVKATAEY